MKSSILTFFLSLILATTLAHGVTNVVLPANAQAAIDAAQDGDSIGLLTGSVGTLTIINKEIILKAQSDTPPVISKIESNGSKLTLIGLNVAEVNATNTGAPSKLVVHGGKYGRILGIPHTEEGKDICELLKKEGHAVEYYGQSKDDIEEAHLKNRKRHKV